MMSSKFHVKYNFIKTAYYRENKESILKDMICLYKKVTVENDMPAYLSFLWADISETQMNRIALSEEDSLSVNPDLGEGEDTTQVYPETGIFDCTWIIDKEEGLSFHIFANYEIHKDVKPYRYDIKAVNHGCYPTSAQFVGNVTFSIDADNNIAVVAVNGFISYKEKKYDLHNVEYYPLKKK